MYLFGLCLFQFLISQCYAHYGDAGDHLKSKITNPRQMLKKLATSYNAPEQVHISFGNDTSNIIVMWSSSSSEKSSVEYGNNPQKIHRVDARTVELKEHSDYSVKFIHRAELANLKPGTHYTYRIVSGVSEAKSRVFSVNVPHKDPEKSHTLLVVADMGLLTKSLQFVVQEALNNRYDACFHVGDIAYNLDYQGGSYGDQFMNRIQKFTSVLPYMTIPGDHDRHHDFYHYRHRFSSPGIPWPMREDELWYSINIGYAHIISINTQAIQNGTQFQREQLDWLENDLIKTNEIRQTHPWIIVMGHRPLYCSKSTNKLGCDHDFSKMRVALEDLLFKYGVDLYISGHKHCYERSFPVYKSHAFQMNNVNPKAPIHIVSGTMGYPYKFHEQKSHPKWLAASVTERDKELYARLTVRNSTHLTWTAHIATNNEKVDELNIVQRQHGSFGPPGDVAIETWKQKPSLVNDDAAAYVMSIHHVASSTMNSFDNPMNRHLMLTVGIFSFSFLVFLLLKYSRIRCFR